MESIITSPHRRKYLWWRRSCLLATSIMARWDAIWWVLRLSHHWVLSQDRSTTAVIPSDPYGHKHSFSKMNVHNHIHGFLKANSNQKIFLFWLWFVCHLSSASHCSSRFIIHDHTCTANAICPCVRGNICFTNKSNPYFTFLMDCSFHKNLYRTRTHTHPKLINHYY